MAQLTWQNVDAPNLYGAAEIMRAGFSGFSDSANGFASMFKQMRERQKANRSAAAFDVLNGVSSASDVDAAFARIADMVSPQDRSPELLDAMQGIRDTAFGYDTSRTNINNAVSQNARAQGEYDWTMKHREDLAGMTGVYGDKLEAARYGNSNPVQWRNAIASIESAGSGDYAAVGVTNSDLGRPIGRYQIMEANIGPWSQEVLGRAVSVDEFLQNPDIQDAVFDHKFGQYVSKYGLEGAAQAWLGGPGSVGKTDRADVHGTSVGSYGQRFMSALGTDPNLSSYLPEDSTILPEDMAAMQSGIWNAGVDAKTDTFNIWKNDREQRKTEEADALSQSAMQLAMDAARGTDNASDIPLFIEQSDTSDKVKLAALDWIKGNNDAVGMARQLPFDVATMPLEGADIAKRGFEAEQAIMAHEKAQFPILRIEERASQAFGDNSSLADVTKKFDGIGSDQGEVGRALTRLMEKYKISPAVAGAVLEQSLTGGRALIGDIGLAFDGEDPTKLVIKEGVADQIAADAFSPENVRAAAEARGSFEERNATIEGYKLRLARYDEAIRQREARGEDTSGLRDQRAELLSSINSAFPADRGAAGSKSAPDAVTETSAPAPTKAQEGSSVSDWFKSFRNDRVPPPAPEKDVAAERTARALEKSSASIVLDKLTGVNLNELITLPPEAQKATLLAALQEIEARPNAYGGRTVRDQLRQMLQQIIEAEAKAR